MCIEVWCDWIWGLGLWNGLKEFHSHRLILVGGLEHFYFHILGISSSQLTNSMIFQRGRSTTNQNSLHLGLLQMGRWTWRDDSLVLMPTGWHPVVLFSGRYFKSPFDPLDLRDMLLRQEAKLHRSPQFRLLKYHDSAGFCISHYHSLSFIYQYPYGTPKPWVSVSIPNGLILDNLGVLYPYF